MKKAKIYSTILGMTVLALAVWTGAATTRTAASELRGSVETQGGGPAVVFLKGVSGGELPNSDTVITHVSGGKFQPAVSLGFVGNDFVLRNEDKELHTTHLYMHLAYQKEISGRPIENGATLYNIALPLQGMEVRRPIKSYHQFDDATGFIEVHCNPHPDESAFVLVFDHPYAAVADAKGNFVIPNVPAGKHDVWVWADGKAAKWKSVDIEANGPTQIRIEMGF